MNYKKYSKPNYAEMERSVIERWKEEKTFEKSVERTKSGKPFIFYDGPPFITGAPHHGTLLPSIAKDAIPRYQTMQGRYVERRWGWDCHGLPAEVFTEKKLGIQDKRDIGTKVSLEDYIVTCRDNMVQTGSEWEDTIDRIGRWVNFKGAYKTMDKEFMESVWWAFKELYEKSKIYEGERVLMYCTRDATPLSKAEIAMDNSYKDDVDPSVYVKFKLAGSDDYLLAWTTTPWTLPSNSAIAVNQDVDYIRVEVDGQIFILAESLVESALTDEKHQVVEHKKLGVIKGSELVGQSYEPLFEPEDELKHKNAFKIWHADFVTDTDGTGIAHESPGFGEEDYALSKENDIPWIMSVDENGFFTVGEWKGHNVWGVNKQIAKDLKARGVVWKIDYITHQYPHCYRCDTKLMYRAHPSWFMDIDGQRKDMLEHNQSINWFPEHIKSGRFNNTIESAPDWNLSRDRFWATPLPVWRGVDDNGKEHTKVIGSYEELKTLSGVELDDYHRPWVDDVTFEENGVTYTRVDKVMDCWFESGSMPFAQYHYPFENKDTFERNFPGDFIIEYVGQVRAWFYYMHAVSIGLFGKNSFKNVIVTGTIAGNDGRKMSKSLGNYTDPIELVDEYSADAYRLLLLGSPLMNGEDFALKDKDVADVQRRLNTLRSTLEFFLLYADADGWNSENEDLSAPPSVENVLDVWILSRLEEVRAEIEQNVDAYNLPAAMRPLAQFIDDLSNWYVRRSRKRFWKSESDTDKAQAYSTLYYVLVTFAKVIAPFAPFVAEEVYEQLVGDESVHMQGWPRAGTTDSELTLQMSRIRTYITEGLAERARNQIKVRQPLASLTVRDSIDIHGELTDIIAEEMNVRSVLFEESDEYSLVLDIEITDKLAAEGFVREFVRFVQQARKQADYEVSDKIRLSISCEDEWAVEAIQSHIDYISTEVLAETVAFSQLSSSLEANIQDKTVQYSVEKV